MNEIEIARLIKMYVAKQFDEEIKKLRSEVKLEEEAVVDKISSRFERRFTDLLLEWNKDNRKAIEKAINEIPVPENGKDAVEIDSFEVLQDERLITLKLGDQERQIHLDTILDRGVYKQAKSYEKGDAVTWGGSLWIAQVDTSEAPGTCKDWRLAVKKGRDGKDLRDSSSRYNSDGVKTNG